jgi:hypothetical protein
MSSATRELRQVARTGRPVKSATFETKSQRKARRKRMVTAAMANRIVDARLDAGDRISFYRRLREMKLRRRAIAACMAQLSISVTALHREVARDQDRVFDTAIRRLVDEAAALTQEAAKNVGYAAAEWHVFSRARIYYAKGVIQ